VSRIHRDNFRIVEQMSERGCLRVNETADDLRRPATAMRRVSGRTLSASTVIAMYPVRWARSHGPFG
jgi:hypothetical protein